MGNLPPPPLVLIGRDLCAFLRKNADSTKTQDPPLWKIVIKGRDTKKKKKKKKTKKKTKKKKKKKIVY